MPEEDWNILDPDLLKWSLEGQPSRSVLKEFFQLRLAIEPEAAALATRFSRPEHLRAISGVLERMREAPAHSEPARQADVDFHIAILYATENRFYIRLRDFIRTALDVSIRHTEVGEVDHNKTIDTHARVFRAIESGDPEQARDAMRWLIDDALVFIESGSIPQTQVTL
jgi:DNA-binding FadR family transcriptional regulator